MVDSISSTMSQATLHSALPMNFYSNDIGYICLKIHVNVSVRLLRKNVHGSNRTHKTPNVPGSLAQIRSASAIASSTDWYKFNVGECRPKRGVGTTVNAHVIDARKGRIAKEVFIVALMFA
mmetsp:Transcript_5270/g.7013  ORF Transcript_5270/g.7013 Transcript_5270/m.7013 type:complete len:121 (+) Transcript_5270:569-931(+)